MQYPRYLILFSLLLTPALPLQAQSPEEEGDTIGNLLDSLKNRVKDMEVPESVTGLPAQLKELRESYLRQAEAINEMQVEINELRQEVEQLKLGMPATPAAAVPNAPVPADGMVRQFQADRAAALKQYGGRFVTVEGYIDSIESGPSSVIIFLRGAPDYTTRIRCHFLKDGSFPVEVVAGQDRIVHDVTRTTVLQKGELVKIGGTCEGFDLNVNLVNSRIDGLKMPAAPKPKP